MKHIDADTFGNSGEMYAERYSELLKSIRENGVTTPIQASRLDNGEHLLENGHHRVVFARMAGLKTIPVEFTND
jgi:ParB-like chromosome segregation protein Spo0J